MTVCCSFAQCFHVDRSFPGWSPCLELICRCECPLYVPLRARGFHYAAKAGWDDVPKWLHSTFSARWWVVSVGSKPQKLKALLLRFLWVFDKSKAILTSGSLCLIYLFCVVKSPSCSEILQWCNLMWIYFHQSCWPVSMHFQSGNSYPFVLGHLGGIISLLSLSPSLTPNPPVRCGTSWTGAPIFKKSSLPYFWGSTLGRLPPCSIHFFYWAFHFFCHIFKKPNSSYSLNFPSDVAFCSCFLGTVSFLVSLRIFMVAS